MDGNHDFYRIDDAMRDLPLGLGMAFMQNFSAFERFRELSDYERSRFISGVRDVKTREEMRDYVLSLNDRKE